MIKKVAWGLGVSFVGLFILWVFHTQLFTLYGRWFIVSDAQRGADAIICLSGGRQTRSPECLFGRMAMLNVCSLRQKSLEVKSLKT